MPVHEEKKYTAGPKMRANACPFIRPGVPFVGQNKPGVIPFICHNQPFVVINYRLTGFTLIELIVALSIAAILLTLAAPSMSSFILSQRLSGQVNDLIADLNLARSEAIKRGVSVTICKSANPTAASPACNTTTGDAWTTGRVIFVDLDGDGVIDAGETVLRVREELDGVAASNNRLLGDGDADSTANRITYTGTGLTTLAAEAELRVCDNRGANFGRAVVIHSTGRVRLAEQGQNKDGGTLSCA